VGVAIAEVSAESVKPCDVIIDFSGTDGAKKCLAAAVKAGKNLVIGTTGLDKDTEAQIKDASKSIAIVYSPNMSIGANFLFELARIAAEQLKNGYDIEITEAHHKLKKDAPSGTAKKIAEVIAKAKGWDLSKVAKYGREGVTGERPKDQLGIHVIRAGDIVGDHTILFSGGGESIELTHRAQSRDAFARGSLVAAGFVAKKDKGLYGMADVLKGQA
jgi:4-hydroxy-tetrahydrodipicolinate reductase